MKAGVSVVITTRNRCRDLKQAINSLLSQRSFPDEVIIVDNNSSDNTTSVVREFRKSAAFSVRYVPERKRGLPIVYNAGLNHASYQWVAFLDDDCIADPGWVEQIRSSVAVHPGAAVILGSTDTYDRTNMWSLCSAFNMWYWRKCGMRRGIIRNYEILDNKNIAYNNSFLHSRHIRFNQHFVRRYLGAPEDCDMGMQIQKTGGTVIINGHMKAVHKDPTTPGAYLKKCIVSFLSYEEFKKRWYRNTPIGDTKEKKPSVRAAMGHFARQYKLSLVEFFMFVAILYGTYVIKKFLLFYKRFSFP